jgi:hypothetical protein
LTDALGNCQPPQEVSQVVSQGEQLQAGLIVLERPAGKLRPLDGVLTLLDPLFCGAATVLETHHAFRPPGQVCHDESHTRRQLAQVPFHLGHHTP